MLILVGVVSVLVGIVLGYFFQPIALLAATLACIAAWIYMALAFREIEQLITIVFVIIAVIANLAMWITFYLSSNQTWLQEFSKTYLLR